MGGVNPLSMAVMGGTMIADEIQNKNNQKTQINTLQKQQQAAVNDRTNLLNQQLASRRAVLGSMGVSMDGSNQRVQQKVVDDSYEDIANINSEYDNKYQSVNDKYNQSAYSTATSYARKVLI